MKQDKIIMLLNVKRIMFVNMFYFLLFYLEIKTESVPMTILGNRSMTCPVISINHSSHQQQSRLTNLRC